MAVSEDSDDATWSEFARIMNENTQLRRALGYLRGPTFDTGFETKPLKVVIQNWVYPVDLDTQIAATTELRKRFDKSFGPPSWVKPKG